jgi:hypothetical protein
MTTKKVAAVSGDANSAVLSERLRVSSILESPEGRRNPKLANELALRTALDAETARTLLAQAPAANPYLAAMDAQGPIGLTADPAELSADPRAARLKEIAVSTQAFNESRGYAARAKR